MKRVGGFDFPADNKATKAGLYRLHRTPQHRTILWPPAPVLKKAFATAPTEGQHPSTLVTRDATDARVFQKWTAHLLSHISAVGNPVLASASQEKHLYGKPTLISLIAITLR